MWTRTTSTSSTLSLMYVVIAQYVAQPGAGDRLAEQIRPHIEASRREPGCRSFLVNRAIDDPSLFVLYEQYDDEAAFDAHRNSEHFRTILEPHVLPLVAQRHVSFFDLVEA